MVLSLSSFVSDLESESCPYEVNRVFVELRPLSEPTLPFLPPFGNPPNLAGAIIAGGGALNHGPPPVAVVTAHSPFFASAVGLGCANYT